MFIDICYSCCNRIGVEFVNAPKITLLIHSYIRDFYRDNLGDILKKTEYYLKYNRGKIEIPPKISSLNIGMGSSRSNGAI